MSEETLEALGFYRRNESVWDKDLPKGAYLSYYPDGGIWLSQGVVSIELPEPIADPIRLEQLVTAMVKND